MCVWRVPFALCVSALAYLLSYAFPFSVGLRLLVSHFFLHLCLFLSCLSVSLCLYAWIFSMLDLAHEICLSRFLRLCFSHPVCIAVFLSPFLNNCTYSLLHLCFFLHPSVFIPSVSLVLSPPSPSLSFTLSLSRFLPLCFFLCFFPPVRLPVSVRHSRCRALYRSSPVYHGFDFSSRPLRESSFMPKLYLLPIIVSFREGIP